MLLIPCPYCGERDIAEFGYGGEAHRARPADPAALSDAEWAGYLFMRRNPKGVFAERWHHAAGCRRWFNVVRDTATDAILAVYKTGEPQPEIAAEPPRTPSGEPPIGSGNEGARIALPGEGDAP